MTTVNIIIPQTEELLSFNINTINDTFSIIINELRRQNKPHHILFYNGIQTIEIKPPELINSYLLLHKSLVTFWAYDPPGRGSEIPTLGAALGRTVEPNFPILDIDKNNLFLQIIGPQYELYILQVEPHFAIEYIILMLNNLYNVSGHIFKMNVGLLSPYDAISDILPFRYGQIILILGNDPAIEEKYSYLASMPDEVLWEIIRTLPAADIISLCSSAKRFKPFCQDQLLWKELVRRDFGVDTKPQDMTWKIFYFSIKPSRYWGITSTDGTFRIIDKNDTGYKRWYKQVRETLQPKVPSATIPRTRGRPGDMRNYPRGTKCNNLIIVKLLEILYYFDVLPNVNIELPNIDIITQTLRGSYRERNIDDISEEEKIFYYIWGMFLNSIKQSKKVYLCNILQQTLIDNKFMLDAGK